MKLNVIEKWMLSLHKLNVFVSLSKAGILDSLRGHNKFRKLNIDGEKLGICDGKQSSHFSSTQVGENGEN